MEFTINVHVTGLDRLADSLAALTGAAKAASASIVDGPAGADRLPPNPAAFAKGAPDTAPAPAPAPFSAAANAAPVNPAFASAQTAPAPLTAAPAAPAAAPAYTLDDISQPAGAWLSADPAKQAERSAALVALNAEFGVEVLSQLAPEQYGAYALRLRAMGVCI